MRVARTSFPEGPMKEEVEHLSAGILWTIVNRGQPLPDAYVQHAKDCRDCREFVWEFSVEARDSGLRFPDLLPQPDECAVGMRA